MHKRRSWILTLFAVLIIASIGACLIFLPKKDNSNTDNADNQDEITQDKEGDNEDATYAVSLVVNLSDQINILVGTRVKLLNGYVQVVPNEMLSGLTSVIHPKNQSPATGLSLENSYLNANYIGKYNIIFSVPKSSTENFTKSIEVVVHNDATISHITQKESTIIKGEEKDIADLFAFNSTCTINTDEKLVLSDCKLCATQTGSSTIKFIFTENYLEYIYQFSLTIKDQPQYSIILNNVNGSTFEIDMSSPIKFIFYQVKNRNDEHVEQYVTATVDDETVVLVDNPTDLFIKITALKAGATTLTVKCENDESIYTQIQIIVK